MEFLKFKNTNPFLVLVNLFLVKLFAIFYIKYELFNLYIVKISKESKKCDKKKKIFKFHNSNNPLWLFATSFSWNFEQFLCRKHELL